MNEIHKDTCTWKFIAGIFVKAKQLEEHTPLLAGDWVSKVRSLRAHTQAFKLRGGSPCIDMNGVHDILLSGGKKNR